MRTGLFVYAVEMIKRNTWAVIYFGPEGKKAVHMTGSKLEATRCADECQRAFDAGFEAGLVAQKYSPDIVKRLVISEAA
jgi:hypothetical protein